MNPAYYLPLLTLAVLAWPVLAAAVVWFSGRGDAIAARRMALRLAGIHLMLTGGLVFLAVGALDRPGPNQISSFSPVGVPGDPGLSNGRPLGLTNWSVLPLAGSAIQLFLGIDGLNLPLLALSSLMSFLAVLVSWRSVDHRAGGFYAWLFLLQAFSVGAFLSFDLISFYVFFELTLIPAFFLIGSFGVGGGRRDAARKFFLYTLFGSLFTLVGLLGIATTNPTPLTATGERIRSTSNLTAMPKAGAVTFSIPELMDNVQVWDAAHNLPAHRAAQSDRRSTQMWLFFALMAGFAVKVPIVPFHTWLPAAYGEAPLAVTMILSAILAKLGTFGILRIVLPLAPEPAVLYGLDWFGTLGAIGIVYAAFCAYAQKDLKLLAAYSSVSHLGFLVLGLFSLTPESLSGATLHMVNHGLTAGALFALLAFLADRYRTLDMNHYGGLWARFPRFTFFFIVLSLAAVGLPGLNNFVSEMLMLAGLFDPRNLKLAGFGLAACAAAGVFLGAWYTITMIRRVFFGPVKEPLSEEAATDLTGRECATFGVLATCCLALGLVPQPVLKLIEPDVQRITLSAEMARKRLNPNQRSPEEYRVEEIWRLIKPTEFQGKP